MKYFLVSYNLNSGEVRHVEFQRNADALAARILAEASLDNSWEVVLLSSNSLDDLHKTHSRYFATPSIILRNSEESVRSLATSA